MQDRWLQNEEHDRLYELSVDLTGILQREFGHDVQVQCGYEERVGYHFRLRGVIPHLAGKIADRASYWLAATTPYRFEIQTDDL